MWKTIKLSRILLYKVCYVTIYIYNFKVLVPPQGEPLPSLPARQLYVSKTWKSVLPAEEFNANPVGRVQRKSKQTSNMVRATYRLDFRRRRLSRRARARARARTHTHTHTHHTHTLTTPEVRLPPPQVRCAWPQNNGSVRFRPMPLRAAS